MQLSKHNIIGKIRDSENWFIVNMVSGQADILEPAVGRSLADGIAHDPEALAAKGYLVDPHREEELFAQKKREWLDRRDSDEIQIFFVPWYSCNFACSYCYQSSYTNEKAALTTEIIDAFFANIERQFSGRRFYITLFGGEPLLASPQARSLVEHFLNTARAKQIAVAVVTNGYTLTDYVPLLAQGGIREVQVTLDGPADIHNARRPLKGGSNTFDTIVQGIDTALAAGLTINFRMVVDKENIDSLPALAALAKEHGWTGNPHFKTQLGRNYELHHCSAQPRNLFTRIELYEKLYHLSKEHPQILAFHKPAYSITRFLAESGSLPDPLFDACPGCKTEWAFDHTGAIYSCTATVGKSSEQLGTFFPTVSLDSKQVEQWRNRDITTMTKCTTCSVSLACGGGCAAVGKNQQGTIGSPDCRPIRELLELGMSHYFQEEATHV